MTQINDQAADAIEQLNDQYGTSTDTLEQRYLDLLEEEQEKGVSDPEKRALRRLALSEKGGQMQSAEQMGGVVFGASDAINTSRSAITNAKDFIQNAGVKKAVKHGMVKKVPSGDIPDELASVTVTRDDEEEVYAVLDSNDNSPTHGEVLPAEDYIRYVYGGVFRQPGSDPEWFSGVLNADENGEKPPVPPINQPVKFKAVWVGESDRNNTIRLRFRDTDTFEAMDEGPDPLELLEDDDKLGHDSLEDANADHYDRNDIVATYGSVTYMELAPDKGQSRRLALVDPFAFGSDLSRTIWLPDHVDINFAEESDVYVIGQVSESSNEYPDSIEAVGVYVHPDYQVDRSGVESMADDLEPEGSESDDQEASSGDPASEEADEVATDADEGTEADGDESGDDEEHDLPVTVEEAGYTELQAVASGVDEVPGSGIGTDEMQSQLLDVMGPAALETALKQNADADTAEASTDGGEPEPEPEANENTDADDAEGVVSDDDRGDFEPTSEDDEWSW